MRESLFYLHDKWNVTAPWFCVIQLNLITGLQNIFLSVIFSWIQVIFIYFLFFIVYLMMSMFFFLTHIYFTISTFTTKRLSHWDGWCWNAPPDTTTETYSLLKPSMQSNRYANTQEDSASFFFFSPPPLLPQAKIPQFIRGEKHTVQHFIHSSGKCGLRNNDLLWLIFHLSAQGKQLTEVLCRKCKLRHFFFLHPLSRATGQILFETSVIIFGCIHVCLYVYV